MPKSRSRRRSRRTRRRKRGGETIREKIARKAAAMKQGIKGNTGVAALVARYITQVLKPGTWYPKTRQLMLDSFIYASLVAGDWKTNNPNKKAIQPIYGKHTYVTNQPDVTGGKDDQAMEATATTGGRRRRSRKRRRKSRKSRRKRKKSRRRRKKSRRRRRR